MGQTFALVLTKPFPEKLGWYKFTFFPLVDRPLFFRTAHSFSTIGIWNSFQVYDCLIPLQSKKARTQDYTRTHKQKSWAQLMYLCDGCCQLLWILKRIMDPSRCISTIHGPTLVRLLRVIRLWIVIIMLPCKMSHRRVVKL